jgi:stress response protein YsnF
MLSEQEVSAAVGTTAYAADGAKLGMVEAFFVDDRTGRPTWVAVTTGLFGTRHSLAPAVDATFTDGGLRLPVSKDAVTSAPHMAGDHLAPAEEAALRQHYATTGPIARTGPAEPVEASPVADVDRSRTTTAAPVADVDRSRTTTAAPVAPPVDDGAMTRSEERLRVGTEQVATTRARLVKYVVTENVTITVPIRREEIRVEEVPLDAVDEVGGDFLVPADATPATTAGARLPDEIILHTERPVVTVEVVPVERVRLRTDVVQGTETVTDQVQREQIAVDQDTARGISPR